MPIAGIPVNTKDAGEIGARTVVPKGKYVAIIPGYEIKNNQGAMTVDLKFIIAEGEFKSVQLFESACFYDPKPDSKRVGFGKSVLKSIGKVFGFPDDLDDSHLHTLKGKRILLTVDVQAERYDADTKKTYPERNRIVGYEPATGAAPAAAMVAPVGYAPQPAQAPINYAQPVQYAQQPQPVMQPPQAAPMQYPPVPPPTTAPTMLQAPTGYAQPAPAPAPAPQGAAAPGWMQSALG